MLSFFNGKQDVMPIHAQMMIVVAAFALMGASSYFFVNHIEKKHLVKDAMNALSSTEDKISSAHLEFESFSYGFSEAVKSMILHNESIANVSEYMNDTMSFMETRLKGLLNIYGFFDIYNGRFIAGKTQNLPGYDDIHTRPWYNIIPADELNETIIITEPYKMSNQVLITYIRQIYDDEGQRLGIICADANFNRISEYAVKMELTKKSYGTLLDKKLVVVAHPDKNLEGIPLSHQNSGIAFLAYELENGIEITERRVKNYNKTDSIVFFRPIKNGWFLGVVAPIGEYYVNLNNMTVFLIILGCMLTALLNLILYSISEAKKKSDLRTKQKSNFLATMSHEIRTPLNAILGVAEIQLQNIVISNDIKGAFVKIYSSGDLLLNIINDILDLSKIEAGKLELVPEKYEVASLINDIAHLNIVRYEDKPIEFKLVIDENIPAILVGDELRIKQILNNLLSNAFKYTERGEVCMSVISECIARGGRIHVSLIFEVSDTGQGMTSDQLSKLFDEYTRFNLEANRNTEGAGLGMSITRNLVELMHGRISVKSAIGEGTAVTVRLPQRLEGAGIGGIIGKELAENLQQFRIGSVIQEKKTQIIREPMPYGHVLIVDDVETNLYVAKGLLAPYGLKIDLATSGFEAMEKIKNGAVYDIIFMDHMMPKLDGIETTKLIRDMGYKKPIVALTANALAGQAEVFLQNSFDGFISKPIDMRQLNLTLNSLIRDKQPSEVIEAAHREKAEMEKRLAARNTHQPVDLQLAEIFARDAIKALAVLEKTMQNRYREEGDMQMYIINVHAMKSALANIGEEDLSTYALKLEQAGRDRVMRVIEDETPDFIEALRKVIAKIKPAEDAGEEVKEAEDDLDFLQNELIILQVACSAYDKKAAKDTLNQLREKKWSQQPKDLLNKIAECILHSEFDEVVNITEEYLKNIKHD